MPKKSQTPDLEQQKIHASELETKEQIELRDYIEGLLIEKKEKASAELNLISGKN